MSIGIMQPYFFPYLGYFELIAVTQRWVVFDVVQYNAKSWMVRNRILHPSDGWQHTGLAVDKRAKGTLICDITVKDPQASLQRCLGQLEHYRKQAPHYAEVRDLVVAGFSAASSRRLVDINAATLATTCQYLGIPFHWSLCSEIALELDSIEHPGQWALRIAQQLGEKNYVNPPGGTEIFVAQEWSDAGIGLHFTEMPDFKYETGRYPFVPNLSILDVLMWNSADSVRDYMNQHLAPLKSQLAAMTAAT